MVLTRVHPDKPSIKPIVPRKIHIRALLAFSHLPGSNLEFGGRAISCRNPQRDAPETLTCIHAPPVLGVLVPTCVAISQVRETNLEPHYFLLSKHFKWAVCPIMASTKPLDSKRELVSPEISPHKDA